MKKSRRNTKFTICLVMITAVVAFLFSLPDPLFDDPYSTILLDKDNHLLGARIASDEQNNHAAYPHVKKREKKKHLAEDD
jgi:penicillin-binding protein 1C